MDLQRHRPTFSLQSRRATKKDRTVEGSATPTQYSRTSDRVAMRKATPATTQRRRLLWRLLLLFKIGDGRR